jgi:protein gp37
MGDKTGIQWTDATWNPLRARHKETGAEGWACVKVSPGCVNCYAMTLNQTKRWGRGTGEDYTVPALEKVEHYLDPKTLMEPLRWQKPRKVFVCSMTDLFGEWVTDDQLDQVFAVMALSPQHTFQVLTKRPERMRRYVSAAETPARVWAKMLDFPETLSDAAAWAYHHHGIESLGAPNISAWPWPLPNLWLGVTAEDQEHADVRIPLLLATPAVVRFVSYEPALGPIDFGPARPRLGARAYYANEPGRPGLGWIIVGGESGPGARPFNIAWARSVVVQGREAGVAVFVKQMGSKPFLTVPDIEAGDPVFDLKLKHNHGGDPYEWPEDLRVRQFPVVAG